MQTEREFPGDSPQLLHPAIFFLPSSSTLAEAVSFSSYVPAQAFHLPLRLGWKGCSSHIRLALVASPHHSRSLHQWCPSLSSLWMAYTPVWGPGQPEGNRTEGLNLPERHQVRHELDLHQTVDEDVPFFKASQKSYLL